MITASELLRHTWDSSRAKDENFLLFSLLDKTVVVTYSCLWDANDGTLDGGEVALSLSAFAGVVRDLNQNESFSRTLPGIEEHTYVQFNRKGADVDIFSKWSNEGGIILVPLQKLVGILAQLEEG